MERVFEVERKGHSSSIKKRKHGFESENFALLIPYIGQTEAQADVHLTTPMGSVVHHKIGFEGARVVIRLTARCL